MKKNNPSLTEELKGIDKKIAALVNQRSRLMCRVSRIRQNKSESLADVALEKELWVVWKEELKKSNQGLVRQLYTLLNSLGYSQAEKSSSDKPFCLYPPNTPLDLDIWGPRSVRQSHYAAFLCAQGQDVQEIPNFLINDNIIELIKLANQCGAGLTWQESTLKSQGGFSPAMDGQSLFINHSLFNFYLFLCLALGSANRVKFNSSSVHKAVSLKAIQDFLPQLGARMYSIEPRSYSLPARLETSGVLPGEIYLPGDIDPDFVRALVLSAPAFEKSIAFKYEGLSGPDFTWLFTVMKSSGVRFTLDRDQAVIHPSKPTAGSVKIPLDPFLCGFLLAMSRLSNGSVSIRGEWPAKSPRGEKVLKILRQCGSKVEFKDNVITTEHFAGTPESRFDFSDIPHFIPLAFPLALSTCDAEKIEIILPPESENYDIVAEILGHIGYEFSVHPLGVSIFSRQRSMEKNSPWVSPDPYWTLGYCLLSFKHKGICLANPGNVTSVWPGFWKIFMNLSGKIPAEKDLKGEIDGKPARKRIRV